MTERFRVGDIVCWRDDRWFEGRIVGRTVEEDQALGTERWDLEVTDPGTMYTDVDMTGIPVHVAEDCLVLARRPEMGSPDGSEASADSFADNDAREFTRHLGKSELPSFEEMRRNAYRLLGDAQDELYSDWRPDAAPNGAQREAARKALRAITKAKEFLNEAAASGKGDAA